MFFLLMVTPDDGVRENRYPQYGNLVNTLLPVNTEAPPTCGSNLLFVRGSQSEESQLEEDT